MAKLWTSDTVLTTGIFLPLDLSCQKLILGCQVGHSQSSLQPMLSHSMKAQLQLISTTLLSLCRNTKDHSLLMRSNCRLSCSGLYRTSPTRSTPTSCACTTPTQMDPIKKIFRGSMRQTTATIIRLMQITTITNLLINQESPRNLSKIVIHRTTKRKRIVQIWETAKAYYLKRVTKYAKISLIICQTPMKQTQTIILMTNHLKA